MTIAEAAPAERRFLAITADGARDPAVRAELKQMARAWDDPAVQERATRAALRDLAEKWDDRPSVVRWLRVKDLAHPSLQLAGHRSAWACDGPHLACAWLRYQDAIQRLTAAEAGHDAGLDAEDLQQRADEAEDVLVNGTSR